MAVIGYQRVSTSDQRLDRQELGEVDRLFTDHASGKDTDRPGLREALAYVRDGDTLRVHSGDRLARNLGDLIRVVDGLAERGVRVELLADGLTFDPAAPDPYARCMLQVMGSFAELQRNMILRQQAEGIALAKVRGAYKGRQPALTPDEVRSARERRALGVPLARLVRDHGVAKETMRCALAGTGVYASELYGST